MYYERVSERDATDFAPSFARQDPVAHAHGVTVLIFESDEEPLALEELRARVLTCLPRVPRYHQRTLQAPFSDGAYWIDDEHLSLDYHVTQQRLVQAGDERELKRLVGRVASTRLDPTKPLWELQLVEGLSERHFALVLKAHPALVDPETGADLLSFLLAGVPASKTVAASAYRARPAPNELRLIASDLLESLPTPAGLARQLTSAVRPLDWLGRARELFGTRPPGPSLLDGAPGPHRAVDWVALDAASVERLAERLGATSTELVLTALSGALLRLHGDRERGARPAPIRIGLVSAPPVVRSTERGAVLRIPLALTDPLRRLDRVRAETRKLEGTGEPPAKDPKHPKHPAGPTWTASGGLQLALRGHRADFQVGFGETRGPAETLWLGKARLLRAHAIAPLPTDGRIAVGLIESAGVIGLGFDADSTLAEELPLVADALVSGLESLRRAAAPAKRPARASRAKRPPAASA